jgi:hypothetical protein
LLSGFLANGPLTSLGRALKVKRLHKFVHRKFDALQELDGFLLTIAEKIDHILSSRSRTKPRHCDRLLQNDNSEVDFALKFSPIVLTLSLIDDLITPNSRPGGHPSRKRGRLGQKYTLE